jgi:branched-chain amino acid transport system permease protein
MSLFLQLLFNGVVSGALLALLATGFGLVYRTTRVFHIAYGALYTLSAYVLFSLSVTLGVPVWAGLLASILLTSLAGVLLELVVYGPFFRKGASGGVVLVASLGAFIFVENALALAYGNEVKLFPRELAKTWMVGSVSITGMQLLQLVASLALLAGFQWIVRHGKFFRALWAMGDQPVLIPVLGLPLGRLRLAVLATSSLFAGVASCLTALDIGMDPHIGLGAFLGAAVAVIVGGVDSLRGWLLGGFALGILESVAVWKLSAQWTDLLTFSILILVLVLRPQGILGERRRLEEI